jgi:hypothetical protein
VDDPIAVRTLQAMRLYDKLATRFGFIVYDDVL